jgi:hypothetical protein
VNQDTQQKFWDSYIAVGKEVLAEGVRLGYGFSTIEVKFKDGSPAVLIRSHSESRKYDNTDTAMKDVEQLLNTTKEAKFKGSRTFTAVYEDGELRRLLLDEYGTDILQ